MRDRETFRMCGVPSAISSKRQAAFGYRYPRVARTKPKPRP